MPSLYMPLLTGLLTLFPYTFAWSTWAIEDAINPQDILTPDCSVNNPNYALSSSTD